YEASGIEPSPSAVAAEALRHGAGALCPGARPDLADRTGRRPSSIDRSGPADHRAGRREPAAVPTRLPHRLQPALRGYQPDPAAGADRTGLADPVPQSAR